MSRKLGGGRVLKILVADRVLCLRGNSTLKMQSNGYSNGGLSKEFYVLPTSSFAQRILNNTLLVILIVCGIVVICIQVSDSFFFKSIIIQLFVLCSHRPMFTPTLHENMMELAFPVLLFLKTGLNFTLP